MPHHGKQNEELETYKDAVWDYMLEHCDITESGSFFVKFHTSGRVAFEKHIKGRWKYNYHRKDERSNFTHKQKEIDATARKKAHKARKESKKHKHKARILSHRKQQEAMEKLQREREAKRLKETSTPLRRFIHMINMQPLAQKCYTKIKYYVKIAKDKTKD
jgi:hypothetical protein